MNNIINQLSQIEEKTVAILDGAADKKKTLAAEYEAKTKQFDEELNHETELEIQSMRQKMEAEAAAELDRQKTAAGDQIARLPSLPRCAGISSRMMSSRSSREWRMYRLRSNT